MNFYQSMKSNKETLLIIDGSSLAFLHGNKSDYQKTIKEHIEGLLYKYNTDKYLIILESSTSNFRNKIAKTDEYKGHRRTEKVVTNLQSYLPFLSECFKEIKSKYKPVLYKNIENDDAISVLNYRLSNEYNVIMCTNDKDMLVVRGTHHNLKTNKKQIVTHPGTIELVDGKLKVTGLYNVYSKIIKGSTKENYKGLPGYGDKKVYSLLKDLKDEASMQKLCIEHFKLIYKNEYFDKLSEGFRLCWLIENNDNIITPQIINYTKLQVSNEN